MHFCENHTFKLDLNIAELIDTEVGNSAQCHNILLLCDSTELHKQYYLQFSFLLLLKMRIHVNY